MKKAQATKQIKQPLYLNMLMDLIILIFVGLIAYWRNDPNWLWLLLFLGGTGKYYAKVEEFK